MAGLNRRPPRYKHVALPTELMEQSPWWGSNPRPPANKAIRIAVEKFLFTTSLEWNSALPTELQGGIQISFGNNQNLYLELLLEIFLNASWGDRTLDHTVKSRALCLWANEAVLAVGIEPTTTRLRAVRSALLSYASFLIGSLFLTDLNL